MVLPGADRESDDNRNNNLDSTNAPRNALDTRRNLNPRANAYQPKQPNTPQQPLTPEQEHLQRLASPDLSHLDIPSLLSKQRSIWKYINPRYEQWFKLSLGLRISTTQVNINRELTRDEVTHFAEAITAASSAGTLYDRLILWPAAAFIFIRSRGKKLAPVPTMAGKMASLFSWQRPANQFLLAYFVASLAEGYGYRNEFKKRMEDPHLQRLHRDITGLRETMFGAPGEKAQGSAEQVRRRRQVEGSKVIAQNAKDRMVGRGDDEVSPTGGAFAEDDVSPTGGAFAKDDWNNAPIESSKSSPVDDYLSPSSNDELDEYDDASPTAPPPPSRNTGPAPGAWDRLRQRAERNGPRTESAPRDYSTINRGSDGSRTAVGSDGTETTETGYADRGDAWDRRRNVGSKSEPLTDSFSFSETDEEKELAKAEAQEEFDRRVERERQGKDFEPMRRGGKNW
jgi:hypothetical protein